MRAAVAWVGVLGLAAGAACAGARPVAETPASAGELRADARGSSDGERVGVWALSEMLSPGGKADVAEAALRRLGAMSHAGMWGSLARALGDEVHGDPRAAADGYVAALSAAAASPDDRAPLVGWFSVRHLLGLRESVTDLYALHRDVFERVLAHPGHTGWRAVAELEDWRALEVFDKAEKTGDAYDAEVISRPAGRRRDRPARCCSDGRARGTRAW